MHSFNNFYFQLKDTAEVFMDSLRALNISISSVISIHLKMYVSGFKSDAESWK